jgi:hypothetical protein
MAAMSNNEVGAKVAEIYGQDFQDEVEGPNRFGPYIARRVWTYDGNEFHAHYAIERGNKFETFEDFPPFANWLAEEFSIGDRLTYTERLIRLGVATLVVLVALGLLVYLIVYAPQQSAEIKYLLGAVVGAAASYVFLRRAQPKSK